MSDIRHLNDVPRQKPDKIVAKAIRLLHAGESPSQVAKVCGVSLRTIQRWSAEHGDELKGLKSQEKAIVQSDPMVLSVVQIRQQVQEILDYRDSQRSFALEMGVVVQKATAVLLGAVERLESTPDEISVRSIPPLLKAVVDAADKVSNAWSRSVGLDDLLEQINEPKTIKQGSEDT